MIQIKTAPKPKPQIVVEGMTKMAICLGTGGRLPGVRDLSKQYNVATATVVGALNQLEARGVITRRQGSGIYVAPTAACRTVGLVFGSNIFDSGVSPVYRMLLERCTTRAKQGLDHFCFYLDIAQSNPGTGAAGVHFDLNNDVRSGRLQGLIFTTSGTVEQQRWRRSLTVPTASFLPTYREPNVIGVDYGDLVLQGVRHLASCGCRRIALATALGFTRQHGFRDDLLAYQAALREVGGGHELPERLWECRPNEVNTLTEATALLWEAHGLKAVETLFAGPDRPDGLVVTDDMMCRGVLNGLRFLGLTPGRDVRIATHATRGSDSLHGHEPELSRLEIDPASTVDALFTMLESQMDSEVKSDAVLVKPTLTPSDETQRIGRKSRA